MRRCSKKKKERYELIGFSITSEVPGRANACREKKGGKGGGGYRFTGTHGGQGDIRTLPLYFGGINILLIFTMPEVPAGMPVSTEPM